MPQVGEALLPSLSPEPAGYPLETGQGAFSVSFRKGPIEYFVLES